MIHTKTIVVAITLIAALAVTSLTDFEGKVFAEGSSYNMADDLSAILTFTFRDGVEIHEFPVFIMTSDFVANEGTFFKVQGVVGNSPHLHKALDESFKFRQMKTTGGNSFEYDYRFFDIDVDFTRAGESVRTIHYIDCQIDDYLIETLSDDYEGYFGTKTGFAIVDTIEFQCGGTESDSPRQIYGSKTSSTETRYDYAKSSYDYADAVRTFVTFQFNNGIERIEFPIFTITSGFEENTRPSFHIEGIVNSYPLLANAIDKARDNSALVSIYNTDFEAKVEFIQGTLLGGEKLLRAIDYEDCHITGAEITTLYDKEEGFTGKSGFAIVDTIDIDCAGQVPMNPSYHQIFGDIPIWQTSTGTTPMIHEQLSNNYNMGKGPHAVAVFKFNDNTIQVIDFPEFRQDDVLSNSYPTFVLEGIVGDFPFLYKRVDDAASNNQMSGAGKGEELFDVNVNLMYDDQVVRGFQYTDCRVIDYVVETAHNKEEGFFKGFALENTFEFECFGYFPTNPVYDAMFDTYDKADTLSSVDLRETQTWSDVYKYYQ